jgi:hypothetical protein
MGRYALNGLCVVMTLIVCVACGKTLTPEAQLRAAIVQAQQAAEKKEISVLRGLVSEQYRDEQGQDKRAVEGLLRVYFLRNESIHVFTRIRAVTLATQDQARVEVFVALAGQPVKDAQELGALRANLYRFDFNFAKEGEHWRVRRADWRTAELGDFL